MIAAHRPVEVQVERDLAEVLGAPSDRSAAVVDALARAGVLQHGVVVVAAVLAARTGVEVADAVRALAAGQAPPADMSDYELRTAAEEAEADLRDLWAGAGPRVTSASAAWRRLNDGAVVLTESSDTGPDVGVVVASSVHVGPPRLDAA